MLNRRVTPGERTTVRWLVQAIERGVPTYNIGDHKGCFNTYLRVFQDAVQVLEPNSPWRAQFQAQINLQRSPSNVDSPGDRAWALRYMMNDFLKDVRQRLTVEESKQHSHVNALHDHHEADDDAPDRSLSNSRRSQGSSASADQLSINNTPRATPQPASSAENSLRGFIALGLLICALIVVLLVIHG